MRLKDLRDGGGVKRWHTVQNINDQTVAAHSWGVAVICCELWPNAGTSLIRAALYHDIPEALTGDVPATAKWNYPELAKALDEVEAGIEKELGLIVFLTEENKLKLKIADIMELLWFALEEMRLGNSNFKVIFSRGLAYMDTLKLDDVSKEMIYDLVQMEKEL